MKHKLLINWTSAMGVIPDDLRQTEDYFIELVSNGIAIGTEEHKFGLLPPIPGEKEAFDLDIKEGVTGNLEVCLRKIHAITKGGYLIRFEAVPGEELIANFSLENKTEKLDGWDIILSINPYQRIPVGIPDEDETPPRHPDVDADFQIHILPIGETNLKNIGPQQLVIGRVLKKGSNCVTEEYIPPCTYMISHPHLANYYKNFSCMLESLERCSREIIYKVREKKNPSSLAVNIEMLCRQFMGYIALVYFHFNNAGLYWTPFRMTECFSTLAHKLFVSFCFISSTEKEELFTYFCEWGEVSPGMFETCITDVLELQYNHHNIRESMELTNIFLTTLSHLWKVLSQLDYIGQHKESMIVSDKKLQDEKPVRKRWTFLGN